MPVIDPKPDSEEFIYQVEETEGSNSDDKITGDNIVKSSTSFPLKVTPMISEFTNVFTKDSTLIHLELSQMIMEFTDVSPKNSTLIHSEVTPVITEFINVCSEDLLNELIPMHDTQHANELVS